MLKQPVGKRSESALDGDGCAGLALWPKGCEDIFERCQSARRFDFFLQLGGEQIALLE